VVPEALSNAEGESDLLTAARNTTGCSLISLPDSPGLRTKVRITTLDHWFEAAGLPSPYVVKLDLEGAEPLALQGMRRSLGSTRLLGYEINKPCLQKIGLEPLDLIKQTNQCGNFTSTLVNVGPTDETLRLESGRWCKLLDQYGWINVISAKDDLANYLLRKFPK
jgi:hypothetical protein